MILIARSWRDVLASLLSSNLTLKTLILLCKLSCISFIGEKAVLQINQSYLAQDAIAAFYLVMYIGLRSAILA